MKKFGVVYGTESGSTKRVATKICTAIWCYGLPARIHAVKTIDTSTLQSLDVIIMGTPTYTPKSPYISWERLEKRLAAADLTGKIIALYGLGDQRKYPGSFLDAMGWLYQQVLARGAEIVGEWPTEGYDFQRSAALNADKKMFRGLALDEHNQPEHTDFRVTNWIAYIMHEIECRYAA